MGELCKMKFTADDESKGFGSANDIRSHYHGWLNVERSTMHIMDDYHVENFVKFTGGWVSVQKCRWSQPIEHLWSTDKRCYALDLSLINRQPDTTAEFVGLRNSDGPKSLGGMYMVPPGQQILLRSGRGHARSLRCYLDADLIEAHLVEEPNWKNRQTGSRDMIRLHGGQIEWLLHRMYRELHEPDFASEEVIECLARQLGVEITRRFNLCRAKPKPFIGGLAPWRMRLIRQRVYSDLPVPDLKELASICDITVRHLSRAFRAETGLTIGKYIEAAMAERAGLMLQNAIPVRQVAASLGYGSSGSFSNAFRRATGFLPSEFRALRGTF